jgi:hypothetical protein
MCMICTSTYVNHTIREGLITAILIIIMILNGLDVFIDIGLQVLFWDIVQEAMVRQ